MTAGRRRKHIQSTNWRQVEEPISCIRRPALRTAGDISQSIAVVAMALPACTYTGGGKPHVIIRLIWIVQIRPAPLCPWDPAAWWDSCSASHSFSAHKEAAAARGAKEQFEFTLKVILSTCRYSVESPPPQKKKILFSILDSLQHRPTGARRHRWGGGNGRGEIKNNMLWSDVNTGIQSREDEAKLKVGKHEAGDGRLNNLVIVCLPVMEGPLGVPVLSGWW